jgi:tRNA dimethylallyltransferase
MALFVRRPVLFIVGPTAVGKTRLSIHLAQRFHGESVNADSRQVYRHMDIGTAKPTPDERSQAAHHLFDILDPDQSFNLGTFLSLSRGIIQEIHGRGRLPIVVGGSGQYLWALVEGWEVPGVPPDPAFREAKLQEAERRGALALFQELQGIDPERAAELDPRNVRRVIRALEIYHRGGRRPSDYRRRGAPIIDALIIGLTIDRGELYQRIDSRVEKMIAQGLMQEAQRLLDMDYRLGHGPLAGPGYREMGQYLAGELTLGEAIQRTKFATHRLARQQYTWFRLADPRIRWLDASDPYLDEQAAELVSSFLSQSSACGTIAAQIAQETGDEVYQDARRRE